MEFVDKFNRNIRLTNERWKHIADTHPELKNLLNELSGAALFHNPVIRHKDSLPSMTSMSMKMLFPEKNQIYT